MKKRVNGAWVDCYYGYYNEGAVDNILTNTTLTITEPTPTLNPKGVGRVTVTATRGVPADSGLTIKETGFIYVKDASVTTALTLENVGKDGILKNLASTTSGSKRLDITDPDGKGARVVAYAVVSDGTYVIQINSQEAKATYQELKDEQEQGIVVSHLYPGPANVLFTPKVEKVRVNGEWVAEVETVIYGFHVDPDEGDPSARVTYLEDAVGMTPAYMGNTSFNYGSWQNAFFMPKPCVLNYDGTVAYYLDPNDYSKKLDGTASNVDDLSIGGNVMLEFPKIWFKFVANASGNDGDFYVANKKVDDSYECWCNYDADNNEIDHFYMAAYNGCCYDGKMRSISGLALTPWVTTAYSDSATYAIGDKVNYDNCMYKCITAVETAEVFDPAKWEQYAYNGNTSGTEEIARARANNTTAKDEWMIDLWADANLIWGLLYLIGKSTNVQATFGRGIDSGSQAVAEAYVTGTLDDKGLFYGDTVNGNTAVKVFGIENFWGCKWRRCVGLIGTSTGISYKFTHGTKDGSSATAFNTNGSGYLTLAYTKPKPNSNYVKNMNYGKWGIIAKVTGSPAASNKYYCDYFYAGTGFAHFGGGSGYGAFCGVYVDLSAGVGTRYWDVAAAQSCKPLKGVSSNEE